MKKFFEDKRKTEFPASARNNSFFFSLYALDFLRCIFFT